jgi:hypothetical protein
MAELSNDLPKELWDKILFTDLINPVPCYIDYNLSYIYVNPDEMHSEYIWLLPDGRLIRTGWVYSEKDDLYDWRPKQLLYVGEGVFHHRQRKT